MRIPRRPEHVASLDGDTMTPMIDVVFLLLVFFISASVGGTADKLLPAELKGSSDSSPVAHDENQQQWNHPAIRISIEPGVDGVIVKLEDRPLTGTEELADRLARLAAADPASGIILNIHDEVLVQQFISVYDLCQSLRFENISFAVKAAGAGTAGSSTEGR